MIDNHSMLLKNEKGFFMVYETSHLLEDIKGPLMDFFNLILFQNLELPTLQIPGIHFDFSFLNPFSCLRAEALWRVNTKTTTKSQCLL